MGRQKWAPDWFYCLPCILFPLSIVLTVYDECTKHSMYISLSIPRNNILIVSIFYRQEKWYLKTLSSLLKLSQRDLMKELNFKARLVRGWNIVSQRLLHNGYHLLQIPLVDKQSDQMYGIFTLLTCSKASVVTC